MPSVEASDYLSITFTNSDEKTDYEFQRILPFANSPLYNSKLVASKLLTKGNDVKVVYDITLNLQNIDYLFEPGDTIGILPSNDESEVTQILKRLNLLPVSKNIYHLEILKETTKRKPNIPPHIPKQGVLFDLFMNNIDIRSPPKKLFLKMLARYTTEKEDIDKLSHLCSPKNSQDYNTFIQKNRTLLQFLMLFPSCNPPVERLLEHLPPLQPRPYSITSSPLCQKSLKELHITFTVVNLEDLKGVCSSWLEKHVKKSNLEICKNKRDVIENLEKLNLNSIQDISIPFYFRKPTHFRVPEDPLTPIILIGPGTGISPFMGFLQHRHLQSKIENIKFETSWLFYGCRYSDRDFLYKEEIDNYLQSGILTKLFVCYSREGDQKVYVQDLIKMNAYNFVDQIVYKQATIYVCGDAKNMARDVKNTIVACLKEIEGWCLTDCETYIKTMQDRNRYIQDLWL